MRCLRGGEISIIIGNREQGDDLIRPLRGHLPLKGKARLPPRSNPKAFPFRGRWPSTARSDEVVFPDANYGVPTGDLVHFPCGGLPLQNGFLKG